MAVQEFGTRWTGCRIVVHASQLHLRPLPLRWRVIQSDLDELTNMTDGNLPDSDMQQLFGDVLCLAAQCLQKVVVILPFTRNTSSAEPAGHRSAAASQQHSRKDREKVFPASSVQNAGENFTPLCYHCGQRPCSHRGAPSVREQFLVKQFLPRTTVAAQTNFLRRLCSSFRYRDFRECSSIA